MDRRSFLKSAAAVVGWGAVYASCNIKGRTISGKIVGQNASAGHYFRDKKIAPATHFSEQEVVIIGGGISGLSAARALTLAGKKDITILEMDEVLGGNSKWSANDVSQYPLGAHYLPIPQPEQKEIIDFLYTGNVITGFESGLPTYNEHFLCHEPEERLYINNHWQEGTVPSHGVNKSDQDQIAAFLGEMEYFKGLKGTDGKFLFNIPISNSSHDPLYRYLDQQTFASWLKEKGYDSNYLLQYLNYAMIDDFGTAVDAISAWVGIHYFAARKGKATNATASDVLTWPAGNGFLAQQLIRQSKFKTIGNAMVYAIEEKEDGVYISYFNTQSHQVTGIKASYIIAAIPAFIFQRIMGDHLRVQIPYSSWMVANLRVKNNLVERQGTRMSWDNVIFNSESLGYINNCHQLLNQVHPYLNLTYYLPFAKGDIKENRQKVLSTSYKDWVQMVVDDLKMVHPNIEKCLVSMDINLWGHAMIQPLPGWIFGEQRHALQHRESKRIFQAHTDYAGISIFEEAFYQGWSAAQKIINIL